MPSADSAPRAIALIPARGGSKRIPRKNIKSFAGKPLIAHSIHTALAANVFARVIVSTDDDEIARIAREHGAEVPFMRPDALSGDFATTDAVILHALDWLTESGAMPPHLCCLYATAPLLRASDLRRGLDELRAHQATTALSVATFPFPIQRALAMQGNQRLGLREPEHRLTRSQDLPEMWHDAGQFYWIDVPKYRACEHLYNDDMVGVELPRHLVQDIDTMEDWARAELLWKLTRDEVTT